MAAESETLPQLAEASARGKWPLKRNLFRKRREQCPSFVSNGFMAGRLSESEVAVLELEIPEFHGESDPDRSVFLFSFIADKYPVLGPLEEYPAELGFTDERIHFSQTGLRSRSSPFHRRQLR
jgi:hypothetical protein